MTPLNQQLAGLIEDYRVAVNEAVRLLNAKSEKCRGFQFEREGYLDEAKQVKYGFHGIGCLVTNKGIVVDFDFCDKARCDGLEPWFVFCFHSSNKSIKDKYPLIVKQEQVKSYLDKLEMVGLAIRFDRYMPRTFFLVDDYQNPNPPTWKPNWPAGYDPDTGTWDA